MRSRSQSRYFSPPAITAQEASSVLRAGWDKQGSLQSVGSQQDVNFILTEPAEHCRYLFKISSLHTTAAVAQAQARAAAAITAAGIRCPTPVHTTANELFSTWSSAQGEHLLRLFTFVEGDSLFAAPTFSTSQLDAIGTLAGRISATLNQPQLLLDVGPGAAQKQYWDVRYTAAALDHAQTVLGADHARLAELAQRLTTCTSVLRAGAATLRLGLIHGDLSDDNIVSTADAGLAVIDFGDLGFGLLAAELAVTLTGIVNHLGLHSVSHEEDKQRLLQAVTQTAAAFTRYLPLTGAELDAVWQLVRARSIGLLATSWVEQQAADNDYALARSIREEFIYDCAFALEPHQVAQALRASCTVQNQFDITTLLTGAASPDLHLVDFNWRNPVWEYGNWLQPSAASTVLADAARQVGHPSSFYARSALGQMHRAQPLTPASWPVLPSHGTLFPATGTRHPFKSPYPAKPPHPNSRYAKQQLPQQVDLGATGQSEAPPVRLTIEAVRTSEPRALKLSLAWAPAAGFTSDEAQLALVAAVEPLLTGLPDLAAGPDPDPAGTTLALKEQLISSANERYFEHPPQTELGYRQYLYDTSGRSYLDMVNNVAAIGHSHPALGRAISAQAGRLNTNSRFLYQALNEFSTALLSLMPSDQYSTVFLVNSGSEAGELAIALAQAATGRRTIVAMREAYHGWTTATGAVTTSAYDSPHALTDRPDWVELVECANPYRAALAGLNPADYAPRAVAMLRGLPHAPAAFMSEAVLGNAGGIFLPDDYLTEVYAAIRERGGVTIADEVQVGLGRLGEYFFGFEQQGVLPDIVTLAKALGDGFPVGAVITTSPIAEALASTGHFFSTAGGSPLACQVGTTVLEVLASEGLVDNARQLGRRLIDGFAKLATRHPLIGTCHGSGLYLGLELIRDHTTLTPAVTETEEICQELLAEGIIMQPTSERRNVLKIKPPMCLEESDADYFLASLDRVLTRLGY